MNIRELKQQAAAEGNKPIRLIHSDIIEKKRKEEAKVEQEEPELKEMKGITFKPAPKRDPDAPSSRVALDINHDVPKDEVLGVDIKESIESEIFGPGGPFEKYKQEKLKEALQFMEDQKAEAEMEGKIIVDGGVDLKPVIPPDAVEQAELEASYDEFGDPIEKSTKTKTKENKVVPFQASQNDPKFIYKIQDDDIFDEE